MTAQLQPCPWCQGARFLCEDDLRQPWDPSMAPAGVNCPACNPYGSSKPLSDAEMDRLVHASGSAAAAAP